MESIISCKCIVNAIATMFVFSFDRHVIRSQTQSMEMQVGTFLVIPLFGYVPNRMVNTYTWFRKMTAAPDFDD